MGLFGASMITQTTRQVQSNPDLTQAITVSITSTAAGIMASLALLGALFWLVGDAYNEGYYANALHNLPDTVQSFTLAVDAVRIALLRARNLGLG